MEKNQTISEPCDIFGNMFSDLARSQRTDKFAASIEEFIEVQGSHAQQNRTFVNADGRYHQQKLDEADSFPYEGVSHYENELICLSGLPISFEEESSNLDSERQPTASFNYEDCAQIQHRFSTAQKSPQIQQSYFPSYFCTSLDSEENSHVETAEDLSSLTETKDHLNGENHILVKGKVNDLQRSALDAIFQITDRPSRVLVLYIASELRLHHVTVKNFFSNARRRVRRAAARLIDPERSKRENRKRKEKRRLAALSLAAASASNSAPSSRFSVAENMNRNLKPTSNIQKLVFQNYNDSSSDELKLSSLDIISPRRRALMEKLADKVQRSAAQKNLANISDIRAPTARCPSQISEPITSSDSSPNWPEDTTKTPSNLSLFFRSSADGLLDIFQDVASVTGVFRNEAQVTEDMSMPESTEELESVWGYITKNKDASSSRLQSILDVSCENHPESWEMSHLS